MGAWVEMNYIDRPTGEETSKRLVGKTAGYDIDDSRFTRIWAGKQTFIVPNNKVISIEMAEVED